MMVVVVMVVMVMMVMVMMVVIVIVIMVTINSSGFWGRTERGNSFFINFLTGFFG